jgi:transcriptional regulator with PAS, ATPase and Fis domain
MSFPEPIILGNSEPIKKVRELIRKLADIDFAILICGESGVGKELIACALHYYSKRKNQPFVKVNCAALPTGLIESELFGYEKGAFTGADRQKLGRFESAGKGSILLDEIGEIPLCVQAKLLQVLQDRKVSRVGGYKDIDITARVITATNRDLESDIITGRFRKDLYYRINIIKIIVPPLRERKEDLELLINHFLRKQQEVYKLPTIKIPSHIIDLFYQYHWPGNIRQLKNHLKRLTILGNMNEFNKEFLAQVNRQQKVKSCLQFETKTHSLNNHIDKSDINNFSSLKEIRDNALYKIEKEVISKVLDKTNWHRKKAAEILEISYRTLLYKIKELEIKHY